MKSPGEKRLVQQLLDFAGVRIDGQAPYDIQVHNPDFYPRVIAGGSLALGESYMDGWWDCQALDQFFDRIMAARLDKKVRKSKTLIWEAVKARLTRMQGRAWVFEVGRRHYDIGNELFTVMLDKRMNYSCAYWQEAATLDEAQEAKLELTCRKLGLEPGMRVLDIGCGWGGFAIYAAEKYRVEVTGVTVSDEQVKLGQSCCADLPVNFELKDYRDIAGTFDRIVSIGMFEHVGLANYRTYMQVVNRCLKDDGLFLLHTIGSNTSVRSVDPWLATYIFPNSMLPSARQITGAAEGIFILEDWHSFGPHYDPTLIAWHRNFIDNWSCLQDAYDLRFQRMWTYYLLSCAGSFRARRNQLWQIVFSKNGGSVNTCKDLNQISHSPRIRSAFEQPGTLGTAEQLSSGF
ncbi:Cyclopropane-fatty-acyl-phospholipid synthase (EC [Olavius sp. associated proteobacterium Delta 1]|nr:Cyclopropane-fatty-acyl-phospholipid synthase (EC [Olavius sp. associated proteobacterium Delta 1]